jgi:hypothetical protein
MTWPIQSVEVRRIRRLRKKQPRIKKLRGKDLLGMRFGKLLVVAELLHKDVEGTHRKWLCLCDCGGHCEALSAYLKRSKDNCGCVNKTPKKRPYEAIYNRLVWSASKRGLKVLSYEDFLPFTKITECNYCGSPITWTKHFVIAKTRQSGYNLDRKNTNIGYEKQNLVVCCKSCNWTKGNRFTYEQFVQIGRVIRSFRCS